MAAEEARLAEIAAAQQQQVSSTNANSKAIKELQARLEREGAKSSDVQVSLMWNNYNDLDLHIVCPSGERLHGGNKTSACGGVLDVDANVRAETRKPVENVFWPEGTAPWWTISRLCALLQKAQQAPFQRSNKFPNNGEQWWRNDRIHC